MDPCVNEISGVARLKQSLELIGSVSKRCATAVVPEIGFCLKKLLRALGKKERKLVPFQPHSSDYWAD